MSNQYYLIGGYFRSSKNLWIVTDTGTTLSVTGSVNAGAAAENVNAVARDVSGNFYVGCASGNVFKYDSEWNLKTAWATGGIYTAIGIVYGLAVDSTGCVVIAHYRGGNPSKNITMLDSSGSLMWQSYLDGLTANVVKFDASENVVVTCSPVSGGYCAAKYSRTDGSLLVSYYQISGSSWISRGLAIYSDGDILVGAGNESLALVRVRKSDADNAQDWLTMLDPQTQIINGIGIDGSGNVYCACSRNTGLKTVYKLLADGTNSTSYDTGGTSNAAARDLAINGNGEVVVASYYTTDEDGHESSCRVFNTSLVQQRYLIGDVVAESVVCMISWADVPPPPVEVSPVFQGTGSLIVEMSWNSPPTNTVFYRPETPVVEHLRFLTQVMRRLDGSEHRTSLCKVPRTQFEYEIRERDARQYLENLMFSMVPRELTVPRWHAPVFLTTATQVGDTQVSVTTTAYSDIKNAEYVIIYRTPSIYDMMAIDTVSENTITFTGGVISRIFPVGTQVMPITSMVIGDAAQITRRMGDSLYSLKLDVMPEDVDLSSAAAWPSYMSKVLLAEVNACSGDLREQINQVTFRIDSLSGPFTVESLEAVSKRGLTVGFATHGYQELWELRQLLHYLHGRWRSFFTVTFAEDMTPVADMMIDTATLDIANCGYADYVGGTPRWIRVVKTNGTVVTKKVIGSEHISSTVEQLTVDSNWPATISLTDVERIELQDLVRIDTDDVVITHKNALGYANCTVPVIRVLAITDEQMSEEGIA